MKRSEMTTEQLAFRQHAIHRLTEKGWAGPRDQQAFDADLTLDTELAMTKRNSHCLMEFRYSFEYGYLAFLVAQPSKGNADYLIYHHGLRDSQELMDRILTSFEDMNFDFSIEFFKELCGSRPGDIYFYDGAESVELTSENIDEVIRGNAINRPV